MATMPSKHTRAKVLDAAMRLLDAEGPDALQVRRIAAEVGSSTMTVYTHFGSMIDLRAALIEAGLARFATELEQAGQTEDPIADLFAQGVAYRHFALASPHLYRMMFGVWAATDDHANFRDLSDDAAFSLLAGLTERAAADGRVSVPDTVALAAQLWSAIHGYVLLEMAGFFADENKGLVAVLAPLIIALLVGAGDHREQVESSLGAALTRFATIN
jgi:AcrR family transcriptional regulator